MNKLFSPGTAIVVFTLTIMLLSPLSWGQSPQLEPVRVVMEYSPPHQTFDGNDIVGPIPSLIKAKLAQSGLQPKFEVFPWSRAYEIALQEPDVLISNIARTPERERQFHWLTIVHRYEMGLIKLVSRGDIVVDNLEDAMGYTIAVQRRDISETVLTTKGFSQQENLFITANIAESWQLLSKGRVDFVIDDRDNIETMSSKYLSMDQNAELILAIPELSMDTWLAANINSSPVLLDKLGVK